MFRVVEMFGNFGMSGLAVAVAMAMAVAVDVTDAV